MAKVIGHVNIIQESNGYTTSDNMKNRIRAEVIAEDQKEKADRAEKIKRYQKRARTPFKAPLLAFVEESILKEKTVRG